MSVTDCKGSKLLTELLQGCLKQLGTNGLDKHLQWVAAEVLTSTILFCFVLFFHLRCSLVSWTECPHQACGLKQYPKDRLWDLNTKRVGVTGHLSCSRPQTLMLSLTNGIWFTKPLCNLWKLQTLQWREWGAHQLLLNIRCCLKPQWWGLLPRSMSSSCLHLDPTLL